MSAAMTVKTADQVLAEREKRERAEEAAERVKREAGRRADAEQAQKHQAEKAAEIRGVLEILARAAGVLRELSPEQLERVEDAALVQTLSFESGGLNRGEPLPGGLLDGIAKAVRSERHRLEKVEKI